MRVCRETHFGKHSVWRMLTALFTCWLFLFANPTQARTFTAERPLVYEDAWDLWPYTYLNENGEPEGYNIDLLERLCKEMHIPYIIKLKPTSEALQDLKDGKSDLMMGMAANFHDEYGRYSMTVIQLFTHSVVYPKDKPLKVQHMADLAKEKVIVHAGAFSHHLMEDRGWGQNAVPYDDMKEAIVVAAAQQDMPIVWNTLSLKWLMHRFNIENMAIKPIDIPHGEYRFMSNDDELLEQIDQAYATLQANDQIQDLQNKWFYPERQEKKMPRWVWYVTMLIGIIALGALVYYIILHMREKNMTSIIQKGNDRLRMLLQISGVRIWAFDIATQRFTWISQAGTPEKEYSSFEFGKRYSPDDFSRILEGIRKVASEEVEDISVEIKIKGADDDDNTAERDAITYLSVLRRDSEAHPTVIIGTRIDTTKERARQLQAKEIRIRYQAIFNNALVDMVFYDANGIIADMNQKCMETFNASLEELRAGAIPVQRVIGVDNLSAENFEYFHATVELNSTKENNVLENDKYARKMLYELQLIPVFSADRKPLGYYGTGLDVTEVARVYNMQKDNLKRLSEATEKVRSYIDNINYALRVGGVSIVNYLPDRHLLQIFNETDKVKYSLTQSRCIHLCDESSKRQTVRLLDSMDKLVNKSLNTEIRTILRDRHGNTLQLQLHLIPSYDKDGNIHSYFGICRDISDIKATELHLEEETAKAQDVEAVKNSFLHNMSYEIRTPLNTVVGFAELFQMEHSKEDEQTFIEEIKVNSRKLLNLVNNILFLSRLDAHMIELNTQPTDFSAIFESHCETGWGEYRQPGVNYVVENNYTRFIADIDDQNLARIIANIAANAAQHTTAGTVRARYGYTGNQLVVTIDDTGCGIPQQSLGHIFERFATGANNGSGLGLSICHELITQMGGSINIKSEEGKGTTVWVSVPCTVSDFERKTT